MQPKKVHLCPPVCKPWLESLEVNMGEKTKYDVIWSKTGEK